MTLLVRSLELGGAERQAALLATELHRRGCDVGIAVFYPGGALEKEVEASGVRLIQLHKYGRWDILRFGMRLYRALRRERTTILHSFTDVPNLVAVLLKPWVPGIRVVWRIAASDLDWKLYDALSRPVHRLACRAARFADCVVSNSRAGRDYAIVHGAPPEKLIVIPNGVDRMRFAPDEAARMRVRRDWGVTDSERLIGLVARLDPIKNHPDFLEAAALLAARDERSRFVCVGGGPEPYLQSLQARASALGLGRRMIWAGPRDDMPAVYNAIDVLCLCSMSEGLPNVLVEAMACDVRCVTTRVGDCAWVVGETGSVVPAGDPAALADAVQATLSKPASGSSPRDRVLAEFSVERLVDSTIEAFRTSGVRY